MNYLKAVEIANKPYIQWHLWASSIEELRALGEENNPLIMAENEIPPYEFGICPLKIVEGELVSRDSGEMETAEAEYLASAAQATYEAKSKDLGAAVFNWNSKQWPLHEVARARYQALAEAPEGDYDVMSTTGIEEVAWANIPGLLTEYYKALLLHTQP